MDPSPSLIVVVDHLKHMRTNAIMTPLEAPNQHLSKRTYTIPDIVKTWTVIGNLTDEVEQWYAARLAIAIFMVNDSAMSVLAKLGRPDGIMARLHDPNDPSGAHLGVLNNFFKIDDAKWMSIDPPKKEKK